MVPALIDQKNIIIVLVLIGLLVLGLWAMPEMNDAFVAEAVTRFGAVAIVILVAVGIVVSPIPSGVVALVAGSFYGTFHGGLLTIAGAILGSAIAFFISRRLGRGVAMSSNASLAQMLTRERSQTGLMATIFVTRLIPFISFDAVSYIAGLTPIRFWRFAVATTFGTAPVCFAFAAAGDKATEQSFSPALLALACGITIIVPAALLLGRRVWRKFGQTADYAAI